MLYNSAIFLATWAVAGAQTLSGIQVITPMDVAFDTNNITVNEQATFQVYNQDFYQILGSTPNITLVISESLPYFHEAGVVTSNNPLTIYSSSNQFNSSTPSPTTNNQSIVVSRTYQDNITGDWIHEVVNNSTAPLYLANGGFPYQDGILFDAQGTTTEPGGLVYLPVNDPTADLTTSYTVINNYLGKQFNSPNDVYVTLNGVIYFTDPTVGYQQNIRPAPSLPNQVYAFVPNTTTVKPVADHFGNPNGITFSPDERTVYITDTITTDPDTKLASFRTIYAFDVIYPSMRTSNSTTPLQGEVAIFTNRRVFAMPADGIPDGIKCDSQGNVYTGCNDGINIYNPAGVLLGKVVVQGGVSNFGFASDGRILALNEEKLWLVRLNESVQPSVTVGVRRG